MESELFGHERGSFTGAIARREGKFEAADGGTLLLDECGDMPLETQAKLLRALQEKEFERVGGNQPISVDVRVLAATNQDLEAAVRAGRFREDLYYRLRVIELVIPPLTERREDIPPLIDHFLKDAAARFRREVKPLTGDALRACVAHDWHGNVRELKSAVEQALLLSPGPEITPADLFGQAAPVDGSGPGRGGVAERPAVPGGQGARGRGVRRDFLLQALRRHAGNITKAAEDVGMYRQRLPAEDARARHHGGRRRSLSPRGGSHDATLLPAHEPRPRPRLALDRHPRDIESRSGLRVRHPQSASCSTRSCARRRPG